MAKHSTLPLTFLRQKQPDRVATVTPPPMLPPRHRQWILGLSWDISGIHEIKDDRLATMIRQSALPTCDFFPDTSFLRAPLSRAVWEALLAKSVRITPGVVYELAKWASSPNSNLTANRDIVDTILRGSSPAVSPIQVRDFAEPLQEAFWYYFKLLMLRKLRGKEFGIEFEKKHGRRPTSQEFHSLFKRWQPGLEDMAVRIAWKGYQDYDKPNYHVDEALITLAALHAIQTGRETIVLTRDHDLQVQFYKLIYLIDTHYRGFFAAEFYRANEVLFQKTRISEMHPRAQAYLRHHFVGPGDFFAIPDIPRHEFLQMILPREHRAVMTECLWFGGGPIVMTTARMAFCADTQMAGVFAVKAETNGANTSRFGPQNCHIWPCPGLKVQPGLAFVEDKIVQYGDWHYRALDMEHAAETNEGHAILKLNHATVTASGLIVP